ncbi:hypothetical protein BH688_10990 [Kushneria phosphatilytica]|nr:hypothetical protein BH688_10990 [Kushneria phosphatilytica]
MSLGYALYLYARNYIFYRKKIYFSLLFEAILYSGFLVLLLFGFGIMWAIFYFAALSFFYFFGAIASGSKYKFSKNDDGAYWEGLGIGGINLLSSGFVFLIPLLISSGEGHGEGLYTLVVSLASVTLLFPRAYFNYKLKEITSANTSNVLFAQKTIVLISFLAMVSALLVVWSYFNVFSEEGIGIERLAAFSLICFYLFVGQISLIYMHIAGLYGKSKELLSINALGITIAVMAYYLVLYIGGGVDTGMLLCLLVYLVFYIARFFYVKKQVWEILNARTVY